MVEEIIGEIPEGWKYTTLGAVCAEGGGGIQTGPFGSQLHASDYVTSGIPTVMPTNIGDNRIIVEGIARIPESDAERLGRHRLQLGDIVYSRRGDVERRALVRAPEVGWLCGTGSLRVRVAQGADHEFLAQWLGHPQVRAWITQHAVGATMANLNTDILSSVPVVLPPGLEQRAIAGVLGALDDKIESNRRAVATSDELADLLFLDATSGWPQRQLVDLAAEGEVTFSDGYRTRSDQLGEPGLPILRVADMSDGHYTLDPMADHVSADFVARASGKCSAPGDVVISTKGTVGRTAMVRANEPAAVYSPQLCFLRIVGDKLSPSLLHRWARTWFRRQAADVQSQTDMAPYVNLRDLGKMNVPIPLADVQSVLAHIEHLDSLAASRRQESATLVALRDTLLPELLSGRLRVREAERVIEDVV